jgi:hypothetical protein
MRLSRRLRGQQRSSFDLGNIGCCLSRLVSGRGSGLILDNTQGGETAFLQMAGAGDFAGKCNGCTLGS